MSVNPNYVSIDCWTITVSGAGKPHRNSIERAAMLRDRRADQNARDDRRGALIAKAKRMAGSDRVKRAALSAALMRSVA